MDRASTVEPFELILTVAATDIDELGHVNNVVYLRWAQDVAAAHWRAAAAPEHQAELVWMVLRHEIDYKHPAMLGDRVVARTRVGEAEGLRFERLTDFTRAADGKLLCRARTLWCPIDARTGRPRRVPAQVRERFSSIGPA